MKPKYRLQNLLPTCAVMAMAAVSYAHAASGTWTDAAGNWSDGTKWSGSIIADGADANANFTFNFTGNRTITLDSSRIIGNIIKTDPSPSNVLTIAASGGSILTLSTTSGTPTITNNDVGGGARIDISAQISSTQGVTKEGNGYVYFNGGTSASSSWSGNTTVSGGLLHLGAINLANIGGGSGRNISVAAGAGIGINTLNNAALNRIVETSDEISVLTGSQNNALDFSSGTGATLNNAFLGSSLTNGGKAELGGIITMTGNYRLGAPDGLQNGTLGIKDTSLLSGSNGLIIGGNRVVIVGTHTFTGDTTLRDGARLGLAGLNTDAVGVRNNSSALQNSVLDLGAPGSTGQIFLESAVTAGFIAGSTTGLNGSTTRATFGGLKGSRDLSSAFLFTAPGNNTSAQAAAFISGFTLNTGSGVDVAYSGAIGGFGGAMSITKTGVGTQELGAANTYAGVTTISNGTLKIGNNKALGSDGLATGSTTGATSINGGTLDLNGRTGVVEPIILNGDGFGGNGALVNNSGSAASIVSGLASLNLLTTTTGTGYTAAPTVSISGTGSGATAVASMGLTTASITSISSGGTNWAVGDLLTVNGGNGTGAMVQVTSVSAGAITGLNVIQAGSGYTAAPTSLSRYGAAGSPAGTLTVVFNANNFTVSGLQLTNAGTGYDNTTTYTFGSGNAIAGNVMHSSVTLESDSSIGGSGDISIGAVVSETGGARALTKVGNGNLTLSATNTYTGATNVDQGTLIVNGNISTSILTTVAANATIGGSGTVGALTIDTDGTVAPGNSPGILNVNGDYVQMGLYEAEIEGIVAGNGAGFHDQINVTGEVDITGGSLVTMFSGTGYAEGDLIFILLNDLSDAVTGTYTSLAQGDSVTTYDGLNWVISYTADSVGGTFTGGNDIALMAAIPEPSAALLGALGMLALLRRRRA